MNASVSSRLKSVCLLGLVASAAGLFFPTKLTAQTQIFDDESSSWVDPYYELKDKIQTVGKAVAQMNDPVLGFNGHWDANGNAVITTSTTETHGAWSFSFSAGVTVNDSFSFALDIVNLGNGEAIVVIKWTDSRSNGTTVGGIKELYRIKQGVGTRLAITNGTGGVSNHSMTAPSGSGTGGHWELTTTYGSYGYMGSDGIYYCIGTQTTGWVWVPPEPSASDPNHSLR